MRHVQPASFIRPSIVSTTIDYPPSANSNPLDIFNTVRRTRSISTNERRITSITIRAGFAVDRIAIQTNQGQNFESGGPGGVLYEMRIETGVIQGFDGRIFNGKVRALGVTFHNC